MKEDKKKRPTREMIIFISETRVRISKIYKEKSDLSGLIKNKKSNISDAIIGLGQALYTMEEELKP